MNRPGVRTVYRWELRKLLAQKRTYLGVAMAVAMPLLVVAALELRGVSADELPFGESGVGIPFVMMMFGSVWLFPLVTALVAGDIFASEDHNGTLKTILTRSLDRGQVFTGKALVAATYALVALVAMALTAVAAGSLVAGFDRLVTLSGEQVEPGRGLVLVAGSLAVYLLPLLAIACIGLLLSALTRNSAGAVVGTLMIALVLQLLGIMPGLEGIRPYLLPAQFDAWQGLLRTPVDWEPVGRAAWVCVLYGAPALFAAYLVFLRRDVAGG